MRSNGVSLIRLATVVAVGIVSCSAVLLVPSGSVKAQLSDSDFWIYQPHQEAPVGRVWCNSDRSVEYWAYIDGEYRFGVSTNGIGNWWHIDAERVGPGCYGSYSAFRSAVLALPAMEGKTLIFQDHSVTEEIVVN